MEIKVVLTLEDNNKYVVASKINYEGKEYYYLVDINNPSNLMFCYNENDTMVELDDKELTTKLLPLFYEACNNEISNIEN